MRELALDFAEIAEAMDEPEYESRNYLDMQTGEIICLPGDLVHIRSAADIKLDLMGPWERELVPVALAVAEEDARYEPIPRVDSAEVYQQMVRFAESVADPRLANRLAFALDGRGAFRRFDEVLDAVPRERARWQAWRLAYFSDEIRAWLHGLGVEPVPRS